MSEIVKKISAALSQLVRAIDDQARRVYAKLGPRGSSVVALAILFVIVVLQNLDDVEIDILLWEIQVPKLLFFIGLTVFGFAFGYLAGSLKRPS